jgi:hypothetical protein
VRTLEKKRKRKKSKKRRKRSDLMTIFTEGFMEELGTLLRSLREE